MHIAPVPHLMTRVRRETRRRSLTVATVEHITPRMLRIGLACPDLHDFASDAPDDHIKLFLPAEHGTCMRDFTPRRFDPASGTLVLDVALHEAGPAAAWARNARPGSRLEIGGPRGSQIVADDFDWYLLVGDETALPAIGRRVEELRPGAPVITVAVVHDAAEQQRFATAADWTPIWRHRSAVGQDDAATLQAALAGIDLPQGDGYIWIAGEATTARAVRTTLLERGHPAQWLKAAGYWKRGAAGAHEKIEA